MSKKSGDLIFQLTILSCLYLLCEGNPFKGRNVKKVEIKDFSFVVSIGNIDPRKPDEKNHQCGGALITHKHVLTAGHCMVKRDKYSTIAVTVGSNDLRQGTKYGVKAWTSYKEWAQQNNKTIKFPDNDISVIELSNPVNSIIGLADIVDTETSAYYNKQAIVVGWGVTLQENTPRKLHGAVVSILSRDKCLEATASSGLFEEIEITSSLYLCTTSKPPVHLGCGDSGGPLLVNGNKIIAINKSACPTFDVEDNEIISVELNAHIRVDFYKEFIEFFRKNNE